MDRPPEVKQAVDTMDVLQPMICLSVERLDGLRTQCSTTSEIIQQELRTLEGKLVKLFSRQLVAKRHIPSQYLPPEHEGLPSVKLWLQVVGLTPNLVNAMSGKSTSLESLKDKAESEVRALMSESNASNEEIRRLTRALHNLKRCTEVIRAQDEESSKGGASQGSSTCMSVGDLSDLFWDSWDLNRAVTLTTAPGSSSVSSTASTCSPRVIPRTTRESRGSVPSADEYVINSLRSGSLSHQNSTASGEPGAGGHYCSTTPCTPVTTKAPISSLTSPAFSPGSHTDIYYSPSNSSVFSPASISPIDSGPTPPQTPPITTLTNNKGKEKRLLTTPPPNKKFQTSSGTTAPAAATQQHNNNIGGSLQPENFPLTKSKSHESQLANRIESTSETNLVSSSLYLHPYTNHSKFSTQRGQVTPLPEIIRPKNMSLCTLASSIEPLPTTPKRRERLPTEPGPQTTKSPSTTHHTPSYSTSHYLPSYSSPHHRHWVEPANMPMHSLGDHLNSNSSPIKSPPPPPLNPLSATQPASGTDYSGSEVSLQVPKSPRTPTLARSMGHVISHRFTKMFKVSTCDYCSKQVIMGLKCKECKYKCHRDCEPKVPPSCGLPPEYVDVFIKSLVDNGEDSPVPSGSSPINWGRRDNKNKKLSHQRVNNTHLNNQHIQSPFHHPHRGGGTVGGGTEGGSSSNTSSCNSSTPSSPALFVTPVTTSQHSIVGTPHSNHLFNFPDVSTTTASSSATTPTTQRHYLQSNLTNSNSKPTSPLIQNLINSDNAGSTRSLTNSLTYTNDSDRTIVSTSTGSTDSDRTLALRVDSQDSQMSEDGEGGQSTGLGNEEGGGGHSGSNSWPRQNSLSNREWDIPFDELKIGDKIGNGHFGTVYRGNWHGDVAIKVLDHANFYLDNEKTLLQFKQEVAIFRKTRHENLVLFMGACMKPPRLAIVTSLCKGLSLYTHLHLRKDKFNMNKTVLIAQQMTQGMSYLHARGIIHKDLKSKNVFLESGKVVITDFGLFSVSRLCNPDGSLNEEFLSIPPGWLCYLAPEVVKSLKPCQKTAADVEFPFSKASDIYAFGTVWYELLCGEWPYNGLPAETIIWQVGSGIRQPLPPSIFSRDVKEILLSCWADNPGDRPDFSHLFKDLEKLPKKRLARSPSHPVHLSRSAESVF